jgi:transposase-like protein
MNDSTIVSFSDPAFRDDLTELLRHGAQRLIAQAVQSELEQFLMAHQRQHDDQGHRAVVRNGYQPERSIVTGLGKVPVRIPKTRDRSGQGLVFRSSLLPPYLKKAQRVENVIPWLYLKGVSSNDMQTALTALFGERVKGLSANTVSRLKQVWEAEYQRFTQVDWSGHRMVYIWADGIHLNIRSDERQAVLVVIGGDEHGRKHFLAITDGLRESTTSWREVLLDLKRRGLTIPPKLAVGDGALGFWAALAQVYPTTQSQRCWVHKTVNVLNKLPKNIQSKAKQSLYQIWQAETRADAEKAFDQFIAVYQDKWPKATDCLSKDRDPLLTFYDFPAAHWQHLRTTNPIESSFATIRLRMNKTRNCLSRTTALTMLYSLAMEAENGWRKLHGFRKLADVINNVKFIDGIDERELNRKAA